MLKKQDDKSLLQKAKMKTCVKWVGHAVSVLSILFVLSALLQMDLNTAAVTDWAMLLPACAAGVLLKTGTVFLSGSAWCRWLEFFSGKRCRRREALRVYAKANIGKYLPGNVMHYVERNLFAGKLELSQQQIAAASLLEVVSLAAAAFSIGMLFAFSKMRETVAEVMAIFIWPDGTRKAGTAFLLFLFVLLLLRRHRKTVQTGAGRKDGSTFCGYLDGAGRMRLFRTFLASFVTYAAVLGILGLIMVLLFWYWAGKPDLNLSQAALIMAAYSIAWVLGFMIPGAPGGIGVREMALTIMLSSAVGRDAVAAVSVLHRVITVIGDFMAYLLRRLELPAGWRKRILGKKQ